MAIQYTSPYNLPYPQIGDPVKEGQANMELLAKRVNTVLTDGSFPASNPDVASITARLNALEAIKPFGHMGKTNAFQSVGSPASRVSMDAAQILRGGMTFNDTDDALVIPVTGNYVVRIKAFFSGGTTGLNQAGLIINGTTPGGAIQAANLAGSKMDGNDVMLHSSANMAFIAGDKVGVWAYSGASVWGTNGYDGTFLEIEWAGA